MTAGEAALAAAPLRVLEELDLPLALQRPRPRPVGTAELLGAVLRVEHVALGCLPDHGGLLRTLSRNTGVQGRCRKKSRSFDNARSERSDSGTAARGLAVRRAPIVRMAVVSHPDVGESPEGGAA